MVWDTLLFTREFNRDYLFHLVPEYVSVQPKTSTKHAALLPQIISQMEYMAIDLPEEKMQWEKWHDTLAFVFDEDAYYLIRYVKTLDKDAVGRAIYTTEGLVCRRSDTKQMLFELPNAVAYLLQRKELLRTLFFDNKLGKTVEVPDRINWLNGVLEAGQFLEELDKELVSQLEVLVCELASKRTPFAFVIGNMADEMFTALSRTIGRDKLITLSCKEKSAVSVQVNRIDMNRLETEEVLVRLNFELEQTKKEEFAYQLHAKLRDGKNLISLPRKQVSQLWLSQIQEEVFSLEVYLKYHGYSLIED